MVFDAADLLMKSIPHARKAVIHDAAHLPNLEHPEEFNRLVLDFLLER
jgi:pimeloyl-ACP methyl ester carboxylesterase